MPILQTLEPGSRAALLAALLLAAAVPACGDRGEGAEQRAGQASDFDDLGVEEQARVEVDPCALLKNAEISGQLARAVSPSERPNWSTLEFDVTPTEVEWGISRRCEYKFQSRERAGGGPVWHSDFNVMVIHAGAILVPERNRVPVAGAGPEIFRSKGEQVYYVTKGAHAATLTSFPGSREGDESDEDATRIVLLRRIAERLP
jgi:hypothetical protein